jgi:hypothetical protein
MSIKVESNQPQAAAGDAAKAAAETDAGKVTETKHVSASAEADEITEDSEASEKADGEGDELDAAAESDESDEGEGDEQKPKKKSGYRKRIEKLSQRISAREQEIEYWKRQAMGGQTQKDQPKDDQQTKAARDPKEPREEDFDDFDSYFAAKVEYATEKRFEAERARAKEREAQESQKKAASDHQGRVEAFMKQTPDYTDVITEAMDELGEDFRVSPSVERLIMKRADGPALLYELAKNPDQFREICAMSYEDAAFELGQIAVGLKRPVETEARPKTTSAPKPLARVGAKAAAPPKSIYDPNISQAEYEQLRRAQREKRA